MTRLRLLGGAAALVAAALIGGTLISAVAAAPAVPMAATTGAATTGSDPAAAPTATAPTAAERKEAHEAYCAAFRAAFAQNLGKSQDEVTAAAKSAIGAAIDQAVKDGSMKEATGARIKERVAKADGDGCRFLDGRPGKPGVRAAKALGFVRDGLTAAARTLDMTLPELRAELKSGKDLKDVATAKGVPYTTVTDAFVDVAKADLDAAVKDGKLAQARADKILARLQARLENGWRKAGQ